MLNKNIFIDFTLNIYKYEFIKFILKNSYIKQSTVNSLEFKIHKKRNIIIKQINENIITYKDVYDCIFEF